MSNSKLAWVEVFVSQGHAFTLKAGKFARWLRLTGPRRSTRSPRPPMPQLLASWFQLANVAAWNATSSHMATPPASPCETSRCVLCCNICKLKSWHLKLWHWGSRSAGRKVWPCKTQSPFKFSCLECEGVALRNEYFHSSLLWIWHWIWTTTTKQTTEACLLHVGSIMISMVVQKCLKLRMREHCV